MGLKEIANKPINGKALELKKESTDNAKATFKLLRETWDLCEKNGIECNGMCDAK